jgi:hypothetical protein
LQGTFWLAKKFVCIEAFLVGSASPRLILTDSGQRQKGGERERERERENVSRKLK